MNKSLLIVALCACLVACFGSKDDSTNNNTTNDNVNTTSDSGLDLDPTAAALESPPSNGKLPADLMPPV